MTEAPGEAFGRYLPSPHHNERPPGMAVELLVVHAISLPPGEFGGPYVDHLFLGCLDPREHPLFAELQGLRVAAHFLIDRGGRVTQYVPVSRRAWHAGASLWQGREGCNDFSVGVELEGTADRPFEAVQYRHLAILLRTLQTGLPLLADHNVAGHQHIAPRRKWDPGPGFDWELFRATLAASGSHPHWRPVW
ncbi:MAG: 1,6-anhydro-N-acetylmuramyl-L-alanine amidase AmpD [Magnetococcales bacterium]|nr:1,6-anhydro-N-acetylmuramyl-L-alanine amidase AmpD [Magnetococcales bacterium]